MLRTFAMDSTMSLPPYRRLAATAFLVVLFVTTEGTSGGKLTELVSHHGFRYEHGDVLATVVHSDGVTEHGRHNHRATRPGLDHVLGVGFVLTHHLLQEVVIHEGSLFQTTRHLLSPTSASCRRCDDGQSESYWPSSASECGLRPGPKG